MNFTELSEVPVDITAVTPNIYGGTERGCSLSFKATVPDDLITLENNEPNLSLWDEDGGSVSELAKVLNGKDHHIEDIECQVQICTSNGDAVFTTRKCHKIKVGSAMVKSDKRIEWKFSTSFYNEPGDMDDAQWCMIDDQELTLNITETHKLEEDEAA